MSRYWMGLEQFMGFDTRNLDTLQRSYQMAADELARMRDAGVVFTSDDSYVEIPYWKFESSLLETDDPKVAQEFGFHAVEEEDEPESPPQEPDTEANTLPLLEHKDWEVRCQGCKILAKVGGQSSLSKLQSVLYGAKVVAQEAENAIKAIKERAAQSAAPVAPPVTVENEDVESEDVESEDVDESEGEYVEEDDYLSDDDFYGSVADDPRLRMPPNQPLVSPQGEQRAE